MPSSLKSVERSTSIKVTYARHLIQKCGRRSTTKLTPDACTLRLFGTWDSNPDLHPGLNLT